MQSPSHDAKLLSIIAAYVQGRLYAVKPMAWDAVKQYVQFSRVRAEKQDYRVQDLTPYEVLVGAHFGRAISRRDSGFVWYVSKDDAELLVKRPLGKSPLKVEMPSFQSEPLLSEALTRWPNEEADMKMLRKEGIITEDDLHTVAFPCFAMVRDGKAGSPASPGFVYADKCDLFRAQMYTQSDVSEANDGNDLEDRSHVAMCMASRRNGPLGTTIGQWLVDVALLLFPEPFNGLGKPVDTAVLCSGLRISRTMMESGLLAFLRSHMRPFVQSNSAVPEGLPYDCMALLRPANSMQVDGSFAGGAAEMKDLRYPLDKTVFTKVCRNIPHDVRLSVLVTSQTTERGWISDGPPSKNKKKKCKVSDWNSMNCQHKAFKNGKLTVMKLTADADSEAGLSVSFPYVNGKKRLGFDCKEGLLLVIIETHHRMDEKEREFKEKQDEIRERMAKLHEVRASFLIMKPCLMSGMCHIRATPKTRRRMNRKMAWCRLI